MNVSAELTAMRREVAYLRNMAETTIARLFQADTQAIAIRHELEQKRLGFRLMAELAVTLGKDMDDADIFLSVSRRLNTALNMRRTIILVPEGEEDTVFKAAVLQGYTDEEKAAVRAHRLEAPPEVLRPLLPVLVTGASPEQHLANFRHILALPFFISAPVLLHNRIVALLVTGRLEESRPFMPRLGQSDVETVQTVAAYLAALMTSHRLSRAEDLARYDPLTRLPNLRHTKENLRHILAMAKRNSTRTAIMFVDLDGFKAVNDTHGHAAGDMVLQAVSDRLRHCVRESDIVGRIGGDEFVVVLANIARAEDAGAVADKIIQALAAPIDVNAGNVSCRVGASVGIAVYPDHGTEISILLSMADKAMYAVKKSGRTAFAFAHDSA